MKEIKALHLQFGRNMWSDVPVKSWPKYNTPETLSYVCAADHVRCDEGVWRRVTDRAAACGLNMLVIDLAEALAYPSHPELAVKGSWSPDKMRSELRRLRAMGLEVIPKLNFSAGHDVWLKEYARMLSTKEYYKVCSDLIRDVVEIFDSPRLFHIGYDEETAEQQEKYGYLCIRQGELWWHDFLWFVSQVEKCGCRPWIWSDACWHFPKEFCRRMPKSVVQSNWFYGRTFVPGGKPRLRCEISPIDAYLELEKAGFDQIPCGSNHHCEDNIARTWAFARKHIDPTRLKGLLLSPWRVTMPMFEQHLIRSCELMGTVDADSRQYS